MHTQSVAALIQPQADAPSAPVTPSVAAYSSWAADYAVSSRSPAWQACTPSTGPSFTVPFLRGIIPIASRLLLCTCLRLLFGHAFTADYSDKFRAAGGDNTDCPCGRTYITRSGMSLPFRNSLSHGLFLCHDHDDARDARIHTFTQSQLFSSETGGAALCRFLHASQAFLRPPCPRPDPPSSFLVWGFRPSDLSFLLDMRVTALTTPFIFRPYLV